MEEILKNTESRMEKTIDVVSNQLARLRTGKASPALIEGIKVDYYGTPTPLNQIASISTPEPRLIVIHPWDKSALSAIEKAILASDIGLTPQSDGNVVRIPIPPLTEERRRELVKVARKIVEEGKVALRNIRREVVEQIKKMQKDGELPEDDAYRLQDKVQELIDKFYDKLEELLKIKEEEIMTV
ncbi:ribosome recycling factor [bacterium]|nr:ribosome recycling factor [bacterium]